MKRWVRRQFLRPRAARVADAREYLRLVWEFTEVIREETPGE